MTSTLMSDEELQDMKNTCNHPKAGLLYWDWRCVNCSEPIANHSNILVRTIKRIKRFTERTRNENGGKV